MDTVSILFGGIVGFMAGAMLGMQRTEEILREWNKNTLHVTAESALTVLSIKGNLDTFELVGLQRKSE